MAVIGITCARFGELMLALIDLLRYCGLRSLHSDNNPRSPGVIASVLILFFLVLMTFWTVTSTDDFLEIAFCLTTFGQNIQVSKEAFTNIKGL